MSPDRSQSGSLPFPSSFLFLSFSPSFSPSGCFRSRRLRERRSGGLAASPSRRRRGRGGGGGGEGNNRGVDRSAPSSPPAGPSAASPASPAGPKAGRIRGKVAEGARDAPASLLFFQPLRTSPRSAQTSRFLSSFWLKGSKGKRGEAPSVRPCRPPVASLEPPAGPRRLAGAQSPPFSPAGEADPTLRRAAAGSDPTCRPLGCDLDPLGRIRVCN